MFILCHAAKNEPRKRARMFPPGPPSALPLFKEGLGERHKCLFCISRHFATTSGRGRLQKFVTILLLWRSWGGGPTSCDSRFRRRRNPFGTAHTLSDTGLGEVVPATLLFSSIKVLGGRGGLLSRSLPHRTPHPLNYKSGTFRTEPEPLR